MKKLLSILASIGLTATATTSVAACSNPQDETKIKDQVDPKKLEKLSSIWLETTSQGNILSQEDQKKVEKRLIADLTKANQDAVIEEDTFTVLGLTEVKTDASEIKVEVKETKSTIEKSGLNAKTLDLKIKFTLPEDKEKVSKKLQELVSQPLTISGKSGKEIKAEDVQKHIRTELKEFDLDLEFNQTKWEPITVDQSKNNFEIKNGTLGLNIYFSGEKLTLPDNENDQFEFSFKYDGYKNVDQVNQVLEKIKANPTIKLSDLEIDLGNLGKGSLGELIGGLGSMAFSMIPDKIPAQFDASDPVWDQWQKTLDVIRTIMDIDEKMSLSLDLGVGTFEGKINLEFTISKLLTAILPDLVHFRHFLNEQIKLGSDNLVLLLIQYLFEAPRDIENDGFASLNQAIPNINDKGKFIEFKTNLERLVHDLLHGWQTAEGVMWKESQNDNLDPTAIQGEFLGLFHVDFKYQRQTKTNDIAIFELLPIENLKNVITQLFDYDLNKSLNITLVLPFFKEGEDGEKGEPVPITFDIDLDLGSLIKSNLTNILKMHPDLKDQLDIDNLAFDWKKGTLQTQILNSENKWVIPQKFDDLLTAKDLKINFKVETLDIKYSDLVLSLNDINLVFDFGLKASSLIPQESN